jgi:2,4'-dihydroxyacetophenone dioxygenase
MQQLTTEPARPLDTDGMPWIPTGPGKSFRPLRFTADGWSELMRLEAGSVVGLHRHTGELHAFNIYLDWCQREGVTPNPRILT